MKKKIDHSITLDKTLCVGCTNCIKRCPTQAIRVRNKKAHIKEKFCIDCGECVRTCQHHAKQTIYDSIDTMNDYKYKIALPAPSFYGQFNNLEDVNIVLTAFKKMGFDEVFEVASGAEYVSAMTRKYIAENPDKTPIISSACPSVVRLIMVRFPSLIEHLLPIKAPFEIAAEMARERAIEKTGLSSKDIGIFFISPCPAKRTAVLNPVGMDKSNVDKVLAIKDVYPKILSYMKEVAENPEDLLMSGKIGISWGSSGGEAGGLLTDSYLAADGIENVVKVLEDMEDEKFTDLDFIELNACAGGCVGGVLQIENPFVAKAKLKKLRKYMPVALNHPDFYCPDYQWTKEAKYEDIYKLGADLEESMALMEKVEAFEKRLPGLDCGTCGAPTCHGFAEDVIKGVAQENQCIYMLREYIQNISETLGKLNTNKTED